MKIVLKLLGGLILLVIIAALVAPSFISTDIIKQKLVEQVQAATGRTLTIGGDLSIRLFPVAGVTAENVSLSDMDGGNDAFVSLKSLKLDVEVMPLLHKEVIVKTLVLEEPFIRLHKNADGKANWEFGDAKAAATDAPSTGGKGGAALPGGVRLSDVKITGGTVSFRDDKTKSAWDMKKLDLTVALTGMNDPLTVKGSGEWQNKMVKVNAVMDTLQSFMDKKKTNVTFDASSDLFDIDFKGTATGDEYAGATKVKSSSLAALQAWMNPAAKLATSAPLALDISGDIRCNAERCDFTKANIVLDKIKAQGKAGVVFSGAKPNITAAFSTDELDLNPFLPPEGKQASNFTLISDAHAATGWSREAMDFSGLNAVDANISVDTKGLLIRKIKIGQTKFTAKINGGKLNADVVDASLYGGKGTISIALDSAGNISKSMNVSGIQAEPFLKDAMNEDHLSGTANMQVNVTAHGKSQQEMVNSLNGSGSLKFTDGAIKGINIADMVRNIQSAFKQVDTGSQKTDFAELGGSFTIASGIVKNSDLAMKAPLMRLSGAGQVDLPNRTINYRLKPEIVQTIQGQGGKEKQGLGVPVLITGTLDHPQYTPDVQAVIQDAINDPQKIKDTVKNVKEQFKGENKKETLRNLRGLFKN